MGRDLESHDVNLESRNKFKTIWLDISELKVFVTLTRKSTILPGHLEFIYSGEGVFKKSILKMDL